MITLDDLRSINACGAARRAFAAAFQRGAASWEEVAAHPGCQSDWRGWLAAHAPDVPVAQRVAWIEASDDPPYWRGRAAAHAPDVSVEQRIAWIDASDDPPRWRGRAAAHAPDVSVEQRAVWIKGSNAPRYWRGRARGCGHDLGGE